MRVKKYQHSPRFLPANFTSRRDAPTFEFYYPAIATRQLGLSEVPPLPFFTDKVQVREVISDALDYTRLKNLEPDVDMTQLADWQIIPFSTIPFICWWSEWQEHLFCKSASSEWKLSCTQRRGRNQTNSSYHSIILSLYILLTITFDRMIAPTPQTSAEVASRSFTNWQTKHRLWFTISHRHCYWEET